MLETNGKYEMVCFRWGSCERNGPVETRPHPRGKKKMSEEYKKNIFLCDKGVAYWPPRGGAVCAALWPKEGARQVLIIFISGFNCQDLKDQIETCVFQGEVWGGLPRERQEDRQMLCGKAHQNQKSWAEREGLKRTKIKITYWLNSIFPGCGGD